MEGGDELKRGIMTRGDYEISHVTDRRVVTLHSQCSRV